jgi:hypothetical protein
LGKNTQYLLFFCKEGEKLSRINELIELCKKHDPKKEPEFSKTKEGKEIEKIRIYLYLVLDD